VRWIVTPARPQPGRCAGAAAQAGALLIDIRSERQRERDGVIPGAHSLPRNVLEWRLDPASGHSVPGLSDDLDRHVILVCDEGYQSSLPAATLQGIPAGDRPQRWIQAWRAAGCSVEPCPPSTP
jgi:rhodanese-related sulfurtransferase